MKRASLIPALAPLLTVILGLTLEPNQALSWGSRGHTAVASIAATLPYYGAQFWKANQDTVGNLAVVPDSVWKATNYSEERSTHWFQIDGYFQTSKQMSQFPRPYSQAVKKYTEAVIVKNGTALWRVQQLFDMAVRSLKSGDYVAGLQAAGTMAHYVGDLSQPLHVTENYDGQQTNNPGIHKFFESDNLNKQDLKILMKEVTAEAEALLQDEEFMNQFPENQSVLDWVIAEAQRSFERKDDVMKMDLQWGRTGRGAEELLAEAKLRMADGAATLSVILSRMWFEAGNSKAGVSVQVPNPQWIPPVYHSIMGADGLEDDCEQ